jgi:hypothetical protein
MITHNDAPQSVGLFRMKHQLIAETSTWQHTQQTNIHTTCGILTYDRSRKTALDLRFRAGGHWERLLYIYIYLFINYLFIYILLIEKDRFTPQLVFQFILFLTQPITADTNGWNLLNIIECLLLTCCVWSVSGNRYWELTRFNVWPLKSRQCDITAQTHTHTHTLYS